MIKRYLAKLLDHLAPREGLVLLVMAIIVGVATGFAAVFFIRLIQYIQIFFYGGSEKIFPALGRLWIIIIPVIGGLLVGPIITKFATEAKGHGVPEVMQALILRGGRIRPRVALAKIIASALCIGTGGSAGREGPIVQVGSALGSSVGQWLHLSDERIKNLVACGAAAGIAATFNAPIAGVVFAIEVLLSELQVAVFGNVVVSAVAASIVSRIFLGSRPAFEIPGYVMNSPWEIILYIILGLLAAFVGILFIRMLYFTEDVFEQLAIPLWLKPAIGSLLLGILAFSYPYLGTISYISSADMSLGLPLVENYPHIFGSGFVFLEEVLQGHAPFFLIFLLIFLKPLATSFTLGSGNSGGVFAPSLFTGAMLGGAFGYLAMRLFPGLPIEVGAYALVGMAAVFSAAARAPLTSMLIVFEMSNDYRLILPLMAAGMVASTFAQWLHPESIYTLKLSKRGIRFAQGRDMDIMQTVQVEEVMNKAPITMHNEQSVADLFAAFQETHLGGFPVLNNNNELYGIVTMQDMERTIQDMERTLHRKDVNLRDLKIWDVATPEPVTVFPDEPIWSAIRKMAPRDLARLPVVARSNPKQFVGLISRSDIVRAYNVGLMRKQKDHLAQERSTLRKVTGLDFIEIKVESNCTGTGKRLADMHLPRNTNVVSILRHGSVIVPDGNTRILPGDVITVLCLSSQIESIRKFFICHDN
ncbi:MAG: chloride channel protein [Desulfobulbaceae bacterium]|jgi:CIC family chloride channel protein|nr:chloride channel protein [Desulfobulbaceae bacterium]MDH3781548.1 chloride channel protein [Desulfobulbaceae bacterium]